MTDRFYDDAFLSAVYDAWHPRSIRDDYDFYLPYVLNAVSVLDVGCGTGTLLREARQLGHAGNLCGLDPGEGVLAHARKTPNITWVLGTLQDQRWNEQFDLIVMTGHAFQAIVADVEAAAFLAAIRSALRSGGIFAFETRNPLVRAWEGWADTDPARVVMPNGSTINIATRVDSAFDGKTVTFTHFFSGAFPGSPLDSRSTLRFMSSEELRLYLVNAGLSIADQFGAFDGSPLTSESREIITLARR